MKKILIILGGIVAVAVAVALVAPSFVDWNKYRAEIESVAETATGRDVSIDGPVSFAVLPMPSLTAEKVTVANLEGGAAKNLASLDALDVRIALWPLLTGRVEVQKIVLVKPVIALEVLADGRKNWDFAKAGETADAGSGSDVHLGRFVVENGTLTYSDLAAGTEERLDEINFTVAADTLDGPYRAGGALRYRDVPLSLNLSMGGKGGDGKAPVNAEIRLGDSDIRLMGVAALGDAVGFDGKMSADAKKLSPLLAALSQLGGSEKAETMALDQPFHLESGVTYGNDRLALKDLLATVGDSRAEGAATLGLGDEKTVDAKLNIATLDIDAIIAALPQKTEEKPVSPDDFLSALDLGLVTGTVAVTADALRYKGRIIRQGELTLEAEKAEIKLARVHALLPGGSEVLGNGALARDGERRFDGRIKVSSGSLRGLLEWLDAVPADVSAAKLQAFAFDGGLTVLPASVAVQDMTLKLDTMTSKGAIRYDTGAKPVLTADVTVDRLDLSGYVAKGTCAFGDKAQSAAKPAEAAKPAAATPATPLTMNLKARINRFSCEDLTGQGIALDLTSKNGDLTLRQVAAAALAGLKLDLTGTVSGLDRTPAYKLAGTASGKSLQDLARVAPGLLPLPESAIKSGPVNLTFKVDGGKEKIAFDLSGALASSRLAAHGSMVPAEEGKEGFRALDAAFEVNSSSLASLIGEWDLGLTPPQPKDDRPVALKGAIQGPQNALTLNVQGDIAGATATVSGMLHQAAEAMSYELKAKIDGKDARGFVRGLGVDFGQDVEPLGGLSLTADMTRADSTLGFNNINGNFGPVKLKGAATVALGDPRPKISGDFTAGALDVDRFMAPPPKETAAKDKKQKDAAAPPPHTWSKEPFDTAWLKTFDANVKLKADSLTARGYRFDQPKLTVVVDNGQLRVDGLTGKLFDGDVNLDFAFGGAAKSPLSLKFNIANASMEKALTTAANVKAVTGTMNLNGAFSGAGASPDELVRSIAGNAKLGLSEGIVRGIDLPKMSAGLKTLKDTGSLGALIGGALSGGQTKHKGFTGVVTSKNGELDLSNLVVELDAAKALLGAKVSLPNWTVNSAGKLQLNDQPQVPPIGVTIGGGLSAPTVSYETKAFKNHMVGEITRAILQSTTSGGGLNQLLGRQPAATEGAAPTSPATGTAPAPAAPAAPETKPQDPGKMLLQDLLKKLEKKKTTDEQKTNP